MASALFRKYFIEFFPRLEAAYAGQDKAILFRAKALVWVELAGLFLAVALGIKEILWGTFPTWWSWGQHVGIVILFAFGWHYLTTGRYDKAISSILVLLLIFHCLAVGAWGFTDHPESMFFKDVYFFFPFIVCAGLFSTQRTLLTIIGICLVWDLLYFFLFCRNLPPQQVSIAVTAISESVTAIFITGVVAYAYSLTIQNSFRRLKEELARNQELQNNLEKRVEERTRDLQAAKAMADESAKAKSEFLANMSHEIRTPLNGVLGSAELLSETTLHSDQNELVKTIREAGEGLLAIINDILDYSRIESGMLRVEKHPFEPKSLLDTVKRILAPKAEKKSLKLMARFEGTSPEWLLGDSFRLRQVLVNLVGNAVKFTDQGEVEVLLKVMGKMPNKILMRFYIRDTGCGMDEDTLRRVFERFTQADGSTTRRYGGSGLGLSISRQLVTLMGGELHAKTRLGEGSTFHFDLWMDHCDQPASANPDQTAPKQRCRSLRILVVDDNEINLRVADTMLRRLGHDVLRCSNGRECLDILLQKQFDIVLMDCQMPELDGYMTTRIIRSWSEEVDVRKQQASKVSIIALTAHALPEERQKCLNAGMDGYLSKPLIKATLIEALQKYEGRVSPSLT